MSSLNELFPELPEYSARWMPIYFEPIYKSGERITIAVALSDDQGHFEVTQILRRDLIRILYGTKSHDVQSMIDLVLQALGTHLKSNQPLQSWIPPLTGIYPGKIKTGMANDKNGILRQAIIQCGSLSSIAQDNEDDDEGEIQELESVRDFRKNIFLGLKERSPSLLGVLNQKVKFTDSTVDTKFHVLTGKYASNIGLLSPTRSTESIGRIKIQLFDLKHFKEFSVEKIDRYEMLIGRPRLDEPWLTSKAVSRIKDQLHELKYFCDKDGLHLYEVDNYQMAIEHILKMVA